MTYSPAGPDDYRNMYSVNYALYEDGTFILYTEKDKRLIISEDAPKADYLTNLGNKEDRSHWFEDIEKYIWDKNSD